MTFVAEELLKSFGIDRLRRYLKRLRAENGKLIRRYWCDICRDMHYPEVPSEQDKRVFEEIEKIKRQKYLVKQLIAEKSAVLTQR